MRPLVTKRSAPSAPSRRSSRSGSLRSTRSGHERSPYDFYEQIFRLKGWPGPDGAKRPSVIGHYTNDFVYARLAPGVLEDLKLKNPTIAPGRRKQRHFQWFTPDFGHPRLREYLAAVTALMRAAPNWDSFKRSLNRAFPPLNETIPLALDD